MESRRDERMAALYARVIHRVCERFEQHVKAAEEEVNEEEDQDDAAREQRRAAAAQIEERWRERLTRYTGHAYASLVATPSEPLEEQTGAGPRENPPSEENLESEEVLLHDETSSAAMGRPHALHQLRAAPSIFATILSGKRKMDQLDGTREDASDGDDNDAGAAAAEAEERVPLPIDSASPLTTTTAPTLQEISPTTSLNVAMFPLQCAARNVNFAYRKNILRGKVKNAIVTLLRRLRADEENAITPSQLLWLTRPLKTHRGDSERNGQGMLVQVVQVDGAQLVVQTAGSTVTHRVQIHETRRFYECVVASCYVQLRFVSA